MCYESLQCVMYWLCNNHRLQAAKLATTYFQLLVSTLTELFIVVIVIFTGSEHKWLCRPNQECFIQQNNSKMIPTFLCKSFYNKWTSWILILKFDIKGYPISCKGKDSVYVAEAIERSVNVFTYTEYILKCKKIVNKQHILPTQNKDPNYWTTKRGGHKDT